MGQYEQRYHDETPSRLSPQRPIFSAIAAGSAVYVALCLAAPAIAQEPRATQTVTPSSYVGTWVGTQRWAADVKSPGPAEEQEVTLTIEEFNGKLVGTMTPFFGGSDGASFGNGTLDGDELRATGKLGQPRAGEPVAESRNQPRDWKGATQIQFAFEVDRNSLKGSADVQMNGVKWLKFTYDLSKKRSRY
jgi:hypothetical protein